MFDIDILKAEIQDLARQIDAELEKQAGQQNPDFKKFDSLMYSLNANWQLVKNLYDPATYHQKKDEIEFHNLRLF